LSLQNLVFAWSNLFFSSQGLIRTLKCQMQLALETDEHLTFHNLPMCNTSQRCFSIELCMFVILISSSTCQSLNSFIAAIFYWIQKLCYATTFFFFINVFIPLKLIFCVQCFWTYVNCWPGEKSREQRERDKLEKEKTSLTGRHQK
jgi:hypothetical protein